MAVAELPRLTLEQLNRASLARQHLLERTTAPVPEVLERVVGLQSQVPGPPFTGLWSRIEGFAFDDLSRLMTARQAIRLTLMRATVHLVTAADALALRPAVQEVYDRQFIPTRERWLAGVDLQALEEHARELLLAEPQSAKALEAALGVRWPQAPPKALLTYVRLKLPLLQVPPRGVWGTSFQTTYALLDAFTAQEPRPMPREELVRRYLSGAGPATVEDFERWSGLAGADPAFTALADTGELLAFRGPADQLLYDLPGAPRPDPETPAPVRILPEWDGVLMMYADRDRFVDPGRRAALLSANGIYASTVLVDGRIVAAAKASKGKSKDGGVVDVWPFEPIRKRVRGQIAAEGDALLTAMGKGYAGGDVIVHEPGTGYPDRRTSA